MKQGIETTGESVVIAEKLPFTAKEYLLYLQNRLPMLRNERIEKHIFMKNLVPARVAK